MPAVSRIGDGSDHGGTIITGSTTLFSNGIGVARTGDLHSCPRLGHGVTALTAISTRDGNEGRGIITIGATAGCGATINQGSPNVST